MQNQDSFEKALSKQRLTSYNQNGLLNFDIVIDRYTYNIKLSNSIYPLLHILEVSLRNFISNILTEDFGPEWYKSISILRDSERKKIETAQLVLTKRNKAQDLGRILAELHFGFWTSIFDRYYDSRLWNQENRLKRLFPNMQAKDRRPRLIAARLEKIRRLRNRVFHYEPIFHWKDLNQQHRDAIEVLGWLDLNIHSYLTSIDSFETVKMNSTTIKLTE